MGSSPHARGALDDGQRIGFIAGIIPACAGSTTVGEVQVVALRDHPRMRGEHAYPLIAATASAGSSPHARGARSAVNHSIREKGIIPACAGSTYRRFRQRLRSGDHPRMRGEHFRHRDAAEGERGSSPHARGAPKSKKTATQPPVDHPRMRGEHTHASASSEL